MAGIGEDIKEVLQELGTTVVISRASGSTYSEAGDLESFPTHSSEFIRQFFFILTLAYDTDAQNGDSILSHGTNFILTNIVPSWFEDEKVENEAALYKCNVNGALKRFTSTTSPTYIKEKTWAVVDTNPASVHALQYENKYGMEPMFAEDTQHFLKEKHVLILPAGLDLKVGDRWYPDSTVDTIYYKIDSIEARRLSSCPICALTEDNR